MALMATSRGSERAGMCSRSMTADVSSSPRSGRLVLGTGGDVLVGDLVQVVAELFVVDGGRGSEEFDGGFGADEAVTA